MIPALYVEIRDRIAMGKMIIVIEEEINAYIHG